MPRYKTVEQIQTIMGNIDQIRNIGIIAHVDHGKTTTSDLLLAASGIISMKVAGEALALDYLDVEQKRGITVKAANISLYHEYGGRPYVVNLIDTPGHVDFSGKVTRSLRVLDGALVVVDAVEGVMTQTETVLKQALEERVRPILFINKVDRLIKELKFTAQEVQQRFVEIIKTMNSLLLEYAEPEYREKWAFDPVKGTVILGAARDKWGITVPIAQKKGVRFSDIVSAYEKGKDGVEELAKIAPLQEAILDTVVKFVPNPREAQSYRIPKIWRGDLDSDVGKAMMRADPSGPLVYFVNDMRVDPHAGLVATGRVFSGTLKAGEEVWLLMSKAKQRILQVSLYMGPIREVVESVAAGNIAATLGLDMARSGETVALTAFKDAVVPFERLRYVSEPVVTMAIEAKKTADLPKLVEALRKLSIEDPNILVKINEETGEYLISGMGPLHLEIALTFLKENYGIEVDTSPPLVVYRETCRGASQVIEGKSPNKHNKLYISVEPLNEETIKLIQQGVITEDMDSRERARILRDQASWDYDEGRRIWAIDENINVFVDRTAGVQYLREVRDTIIQGFRLAMKEGPIAMEPVRGVKVILHDAVIHEDPAHRGPAQLYPATRNPIYAGILMTRPTLLEPLQKLDVRVPADLISSVISVVSRRRGKVIDVVYTTPTSARIIAELPIAESMDLASELRSATAGRAFWGTEFSKWSPVPEQILPAVVKAIRTRKGLSSEPPEPEDFVSQY